MRTFGVLAVVAAVGAGCATSSAAVGTAAMTTAVAVGAAAVSRAQGKCYAACPDGTQCVEKTGLCEPIPCRGRCATNQRCDQSGPVERCVPAAEVDLKIVRPGAAPEAERVTPQ